MPQNKSEVARLLQQITAEHEAAQHAVHGLAAGTALHRFINARMEQDAAHLLQLLRAGKIAECDQIVSEMARELNEGGNH